MVAIIAVIAAVIAICGNKENAGASSDSAQTVESEIVTSSDTEENADASENAGLVTSDAVDNTSDVDDNTSDDISDTPATSDTAVTPDAPTGISHTVNEDGVVTITWDSVEDIQTYEYEIYSDNDMVANQVVTAKAVDIVGVSPNHSWSFKLRAIVEKDGETYYSDWTSYQFEIAQQDSDNTGAETLTSIENLSLTRMEDQSLNVEWDKAEGATGYIFEMYSDAGYTQRTIEKNLSIPGIILTGVEKGSVLYIRVCPIKDGSTDGYAWKAFNLVC